MGAGSAGISQAGAFSSPRPDPRPLWRHSPAGISTLPSPASALLPSNSAVRSWEFSRSLSPTLDSWRGATMAAAAEDAASLRCSRYSASASSLMHQKPSSRSSCRSSRRSELEVRYASQSAHLHARRHSAAHKQTSTRRSSSKTKTPCLQQTAQQSVQLGFRTTRHAKYRASLW